MPHLRRRSLLTAAAIAAAASQLPTNPQVAHAAPATTSPPPGTDRLAGGVRLRWLEGTPPALAGNGTPQEQEAETGQSWGNRNLRQAHSRLNAYAAAKTGDASLAARAWQEFYTGHAGYPRDLDWRTERVEPPAVLKPIDETSFASTNASSQYGLAAIQCLALVGDHLP